MQIANIIITIGAMALLGRGGSSANLVLMLADILRESSARSEVVMRSEKEIRKKIEELEGYRAMAISWEDSSIVGRYQMMIELLRWVLGEERGEDCEVP